MHSTPIKLPPRPTGQSRRRSGGTAEAEG